MTMLRVLHTVPGGNWGGVEHRVVSQARWLGAHGVPVWIATPPDGATWEQARAASIDVLALPFPALSLAGSALRLRRMLRQVKPSIIDCHGNMDSKAALLCRDLAGVVRTVHVTPQARDGLLHRVKWNAGYRSVIAVSHSIAERLRRDRVFFPERDAVIGEWAEPEFFAVPDLAAPASPLRLLMVGMLRPEKGADLALAAMRKLSARGVAAELSIAGCAPAEHRAFEAALQQEAAAAGLSSTVRFLGLRDDVAALLAACDIVIIPSRVEAQSRIAAQAMAAGRPVVASAVGGLPELVRAGETGWLVPADDAAALAGCLALLARDPAALIAAGAAARTFARRHLGIDESMSATIGAYQKALGRSPARRRVAHILHPA